MSENYCFEDYEDHVIETAQNYKLPTFFYVNFFSGLALIFLFVFFGSILNTGKPISIWIYLLSFISPIVGAINLNSADFFAIVLNPLIIIYSLSTIWLVFSFFMTPKPENPNFIVYVTWIWTFCTGVGLILVGIAMFLNMLSRGSRSNRN